MGTDKNVTINSLNPVVCLADRVLDKLVIPGYSSIGPSLRKFWWPADAAPFRRPVDIVVTGGSSGIGAATAAGLAALGGRVHLVGRKAETLQTSASKIRLQVPDAELVIHEADISDLDAVRALTATLKDQLDSLHAVVHCAGVMPPERRTTAQGHETAFATHVLGPFLLTTGLRPLLQADGDGRVVFVSSGGMYTAELESDLEYTAGEYKGVRAYARTKRMQVVLTEQLGRAFAEDRDPVVHSMHPGWAATPGVTDSIPGFGKIAKPILRTPAQGADTIVWLAASPEAALSTGKFWSDRRPRPTHYLPWQKDNPVARQQLWDTCISATGALVG
jgi:NAD(P)-dependent dehydrogenase (short-subunit alcohol dehydrogenase family)